MRRSAKPRRKKKAILIGLDGMPADFIDRYRDRIPELKKLVEAGFFSPSFPSPTTETATNWTTIATGAYIGTHGITSFHAHLPGMELGKTVPTLNSDLCLAEYFWQAAERQGKRSILINYPTAFPVRFKQGVVIGGDGLASEQWSARWPDFMSTFRDLEGGSLAARKSSVFGEVTSALRLVEGDRSGWTNLPSGMTPLREWIAPFQEAEKFDWGALGIIIEEKAEQTRNPAVEKRYALVAGKDDGTCVIFAKERNYNKAIAVLKRGEWSGWVEEEFFGTRCIRQYKAIDLSEDGKEVTIYGTMGGCHEGWGFPRGIEKEIIKNAGPYIEALEITPDQGLTNNWFGADVSLEIMGIQADWMVQCASYLSRTQEWDCMFLQYHAPDGINHMIMGDFESDDPQVVRDADTFMHGVYSVMFRLVDAIRRACADDNTFVFVVSDHGAVPIRHYVNTHSMMIREGWEVFARDKQRGLWSIDTEKSRAAYAHWNGGIWINLKGRQKYGCVEPGEEYEELRDAIINRLRKITNGQTGEPVFDLVARREALHVMGMWGERIPDVVAFARPYYLFMGGKLESIQEELMDLYQSGEELVPLQRAFDAGVIRPVYGMHWQLPCATVEGLSSLRSVFIVCGPGVKKNHRGERVNNVDFAATMAHVIGIHPPRNSEGRVIGEAFEGSG